ncbi:MAG: peptidylprolyl isomerase [Chthoniobacterales bacterium]|jgi:peptidyl-prolyl cis-trans isomerase D
MFTTIRKHQRWLMLVIAFLTIIAFAFLYNTTEMDRVGSNIVARIYGRDVMQVDVERAVRNYQLALALGQFDLVRDLAGQARSEEEAANNFIWNLMVLQHQAAALDIEPGAQAVVDKIRGLPAFQKDGRFDPLQYSEFVQQQLAPRGFTERQVEDVIADSLRLQEIKSLVESPAVVLPGDIEPALARMAPADVVLVEFDAAELAKKVDVSDEELRQAYEERKQSLLAPEMRTLRYAAFLLSREDAKKKGKERIEVLQKIANKTNDFAQALADSERGMESFGKAEKTDVHTTPFFDAEGTADGKLFDQDADVIASGKAVAFRLSPQPGNYEILELGEKGYAVVEVASVKVPRQLKFDEARADLRAELITQKRDRAVIDKATSALPELRVQLAAGTSLAEAAKKEGLATREMPGLSLFDSDLAADQREVAVAVADLPEGSLGEFQARPGGGGFAAYVARRTEPSEKDLAERRPMIESGALQGKKMLLFAQWLADARRQSGLEMLRPAM